MTRAMMTYALLVGALMLTAPGVAQAESESTLASDSPRRHAAVTAPCPGDGSGPTITGITPGALVLGATPTAHTFTVTATDQCGLAGWRLRLDHGATQVDVSSANPTAQVQAPARNAWAGWNSATVTATDHAGNSTTQLFPLRLLRHAALQGVTMQRIEGGARMRATAHLLRADWERGTQATYAQQPVALEFQPSGTTTWRHVTFAQTQRTGLVQATASHLHDSRSWQAGQWRLRYPGDEFTSPATSPAMAVDAGPTPPVRAPDPRGACPNDSTAPELGNSGLVNPLVIGMGPVGPGYQLDGTDECGIANWSISHSGIAQLRVDQTDPTTTVDPPAFNRYAGWGDMRVSAVDTSARHNSATRSFGFRVLRQTRWLHQSRQLVSPGYSVPGQPAKRLVLTATMVKANWAQPHRGWIPAGGTKVALQFLPRGHEQQPWQHKGFAVTNSQGKATAVWQAPEGLNAAQLARAYNGSWRLVYLGSGVHSASTLDQVSTTWAAP